jgi:hypothetical protein
MRYTRSRAIRLKCYDCSGFSKPEILKCPIKDCALFPYRTGREVAKDFSEPKGYKSFSQKNKG